MVTRITGTAGNDSLISNLSDTLILSGLAGADTLRGGAGNDRIYGGAGADVLYVGAGMDVLYGGADNDTYILGPRAVLPAWTIFEGADGGEDRLIIRSAQVRAALPDFVETVLIQADVRVFEGNDAANAIDASARAAGMTIHALGGNDRVIGTAGADVIDGGAGVDTLQGGDGSDTYIVDHARDVTRELLANGDIDRVVATVSYALQAGVEQLALRDQAGRGIGNDLDNGIEGNARSNELLGRGGDDVMGGRGGNDTLRGEGGNDVLDGGVGRDILFGGAGADVFCFLSAEDTGRKPSGADVIRDFEAGDLIDLSSVDANTRQAGVQGFTFVLDSPFSRSAGELRFYAGYLLGDRNGDGDTDFAIAVTGTLAAINDALLL